MPKSTGATGRGITIDISDGEVSPIVFVTVANVTSITLNGRDVNEIDFTHLLSDGGFREYRPGFKDAGSLALEFHFSAIETSHQKLQQLWLNGSIFLTRLNLSPLGLNWNKYLIGESFVKNPGDITVDVSNPVKGASVLRFTGETYFGSIAEPGMLDFGDPGFSGLLALFGDF